MLQERRGRFQEIKCLICLFANLSLMCDDRQLVTWVLTMLAKTIHVGALARSFDRCVRYAAAIGFATVVSENVYGQQTTELPFFGMHIHRSTSGSAWPKVRFGAWRLWDAGVQWAELEPSREKWQFGLLDQYVAMARITGVSVLLPLGMTPKWAATRPSEPSAYGDGRASEPRQLSDWKAYVRAIATRYQGRIREYELWNEPNSKDLFSGSMSNLVELACTARDVLKEIDSGNRLISPAFTGTRNIAMLDQFLKLGGRTCVDVVAYHFYVPEREPEDVFGYVKQVRAVMTANGLGQMELWNTESGWAIENRDGTQLRGIPKEWKRVRPEQSASYVSRTLLLGRAAGLERFYWYSWDSDSMGLVEPSTGELKGGALAFGNLVQWLVGRSRPECTVNSHLWTCTIHDTEGNEWAIAWKVDGKSQKLRHLSGRSIASVQSVDGREIPFAEQGLVEVDSVPILMKLRR